MQPESFGVGKLWMWFDTPLQDQDKISEIYQEIRFFVSFLSTLFLFCPIFTTIIVITDRYSKIETLRMTYNWHWVSSVGINFKINIFGTFPVKSANVNRKNTIPQQIF